MKSGFSRFRRNSRADKAKRQAGQRRRFFRPGLVEKLEDRQMLSGIHDDGGISEVLVAEGEGGGMSFSSRAWNPGVDRNNTRLGNPQPIQVPVTPRNPVNVVETSVNNDTPSTAQTVSGVGTLAGQNSQVTISGTVSTFTDTDWFRVHLRAGDIVSVRALAAANELALFNSDGIELQGHNQTNMARGDHTLFWPTASPLLRGGNANLAYVITEEGDYFLYVSAADNVTTTGGSAYQVEIDLHRPVLESQPVGSRQIVYLDFNGALIQRAIFDDTAIGTARLSPLVDFLPYWGLDSQNEDQVIDAIIETFEEKFREVGLLGSNGDFDSTGRAGDFGIEVLNSRDNP
ncbi:MAG: hypothetical protein R3C09_28910, partial [Pirellulaceae bacterium]